MTIWYLTPEYIIYLNLGLCFCAAILSLVSCSVISISRSLDQGGYPYLMSIGCANLLLSIAYIIEVTFEGTPGGNIYWLLMIADFAEYLMPYLMSFIFLYYIIYRVEENGGKIRHRWRFWLVEGIIMSALVIFTVNGGYFYIDQDNYYHRGEFFALSQLFGILMVFLGIILVRYYRVYFHPCDRRALIMYLAAPFVAVVLQVLMEGMDIFLLASTVSLLLIITYLQLRQSRMYFLNEEELKETRVNLMLSQMRPHFIYNALSSISQLCKKDPQRASEMTDRFAEYLRKNMEDVKKKELIPFTQELKHLENYIAIEQMRFGDMIRVVYDTSVKDFNIPPLVLQPVVENAIRHGIRGREEAGTIQIASRYQDGSFIITISDDGVGFDTKAIKKDGNLHLGLDSIRKKVSSIPQASFIISSTPGVGTTATFIFPDMGA